ncbi:amidohydrolase family protein [Lacisediminihabitans sp.]|uniref:amidohydrolase family protein n=1 Tax=Lacisediminihabitans sp. TaxID=2787631 RepID=UPI00374D0901
MDSPHWAALADVRLTEWTPRSQLTARVTEVARARFAAIDIHNHLGRWLSDGEWMIGDVAALLELMDARNVETIVSLDGMWGDELEANLDRYDRAHPGRFLTFCQLDWALLARPDGERMLRDSLDDSAGRGAKGLKVWKNLGLTVRDATGALVLPDDERVVRVLAHAGELGLPVLIHVADPRAFFQPADENNERLDELLQQKDWWFGDTDRHPTFERLLDALATLVIATPGTRYIGAHAGCAAEDLDRVERLLAAAPHFSIDIAGRMAELGRQPRRFRELIERFPDRVLFGTDIFPITSEQYELHFRFLESRDEAFEYAPESPIPPQGRWTVSALHLSDPQLEAIYRGNALRVLGP